MPFTWAIFFFFFWERDPKPPLILGFMCCVVICVSSTVLSLKTTTTKQQMVKNEVWICCCLYGLDLEDWSSLYHVPGMLILFLLRYLQTESEFLSESSCERTAQLETGTTPGVLYNDFCCFLNTLIDSLFTMPVSLNQLLLSFTYTYFKGKNFRKGGS